MLKKEVCFEFYYRDRIFVAVTEFLVRMKVLLFKKVGTLQLSSKCLRQSRFKLFVCLFDLCLFCFVGFLYLLVSGKGCGL